MLTKDYISVVNAVLRVIPEDEIAVAIAKGQRDSQEKWEWGDRALNWIDIALTSGIACTKDHVYTALSQVSGIPKRTLRHYADHASFFPAEIRDEYEPMPYSHFMVAKTFGDKWKELLCTSADHLEKFGKYPTAEWLEWRFSNGAKPVLEVDEKVQQETYHIVETSFCVEVDERADYDKDIWVASEAVMRDSFSRWYTSIDRMLDLLPSFPINEDRQAKLHKAMTDVLSEIEEAVKEISHPVPKGR